MKKPLVTGILGLLIGVSIGAGAMWRFGPPTRNHEAANDSRQPGRNRVETDPVCMAFDRDKLFKRLIDPRRATETGDRIPTEFEHEGGGGANLRVAYGVWEADRLDDKELLKRALAAVKAVIVEAGARTIDEKDLTIRTIATGTQTLHYFNWPYWYRAKPGDQDERWGHATVWVTRACKGKQYSVAIRIGW